MTAARPDPFARWRRAAAVRAVAAVAGGVPGGGNAGDPPRAADVATVARVAGEGGMFGAADPFAALGRQEREAPVPCLTTESAARAAALLRFACEAAAALAEREPDPIEDAERAAAFGACHSTPRARAAATIDT